MGFIENFFKSPTIWIHVEFFFISLSPPHLDLCGHFLSAGFLHTSLKNMVEDPPTVLIILVFITPVLIRSVLLLSMDHAERVS